MCGVCSRGVGAGERRRQSKTEGVGGWWFRPAQTRAGCAARRVRPGAPFGGWMGARGERRQCCIGRREAGGRFSSGDVEEAARLVRPRVVLFVFRPCAMERSTLRLRACWAVRPAEAWTHKKTTRLGHPRITKMCRTEPWSGSIASGRGRAPVSRT